MNNGEATKNNQKMRHYALVTIICDAILLVVFAACLLVYNYANSITNYEQNVESVSDIAAANSKLMTAAFDTASKELRRAYNWCAGKNLNEILDYLSVIGNGDEEYQLLSRDTSESTDYYHVYRGYSTVKNGNDYRTVIYDATALADSIYIYSNSADGVVSYSQSFNNPIDSLRYFAAFCGITVDENGIQQRYYLVKPQKESTVLEQAQNYSKYENMALAVCYTDGKYLARNGSFRGENFYEYIKKYNNLSIDERNAIRTSVMSDSDGVGVLTYNDYQRRSSVFAYSVCGENDEWIVVVGVPERDFTTERVLTAFPTLIIVFLTFLLVFNIWRLLAMVKELRAGVVREQVANASKSSFLSRMSHEIRTPLNAVIGYNTIAKNEISGIQNDNQRRQAEMKVVDCLSKSEIASKHLLTVINDVLDMSAIESGKIRIAEECFDFRGLISSLTTVFYSQARAKGVDLEVIFNSLTEEWFIGDQMRINQILTNLLSNAIKFTPEGGSVILRITQPEAETEATHIRFEVSDTGIGMTQDYLERIWQPFEQADASISRRFGGSGLGLSITKTLVDLMHGTISVESKHGVGTSFTVDLVLGKAVQPENSIHPCFSKINALVVDDDAGTCDYIRLLFNRCGAKCVAVTSGEDALHVVKDSIEFGAPFTVCLVDWRMPKMDGIETIAEIRKIAGDDMPIVVLTAYDYSEIADKAASVGISRFISKPLFQSSLFDLLANICGTNYVEREKTDVKPDFSGARVLLAEDNEMNMEIAKTLLETANITVDCAWNGKEAVKLFCESEPGTYRAILMDVHMPELNGYDATRTIRSSAHSEAASVPIIAMTADAFAENVAEAYAVGMNAHIPKPIDVNEMFSVLKKFIK